MSGIGPMRNKVLPWPFDGDMVERRDGPSSLRDDDDDDETKLKFNVTTHERLRRK